MLIAAIFISNNQIWKQPKCTSIDEWVKKMWLKYNGIILSHEIDEILPCDNMDGSESVI